MKNEKISIIVPIYNTVNLLERCLNSIVSQTYENLEIICVDDGSTDGSEKIVDELCKADDRIIAIHQSNSGESNARNTGLRVSTGEYIAFCDCDDWIDKDMYQIMIHTIVEDDLDMVATSWIKEYPNKSERIYNNGIVSRETFGRDQLLYYIYKRDQYRGFAYMWNKLYRRKVLMDTRGNIMLFDENLLLGGDVLYLARAALNVQRCKYIDLAFYHYNQRNGSGCHTRDMRKLTDWIKAYVNVIDIFETNNISEDIVDYVKRFTAYHCSNALEIALEDGRPEYKTTLQELMKKYEREYTKLNVNYPDRVLRYKDLLGK